MEQVETRWVTIGSGTVCSGSFDGEVNQAVVGRAEVSVFVHDFHRYEREVFSVGHDFVTIGCQFDTIGFTSCFHLFFGNCVSVFIIGDDFDSPRFVFGVRPHQTVAFLPFEVRRR